MRNMSRNSFRGTAGRYREAIILAGGFGTRLAHVLPNICKPMAPVLDKPFLSYILDQLDAAGFSRVVIADGYRREQIENYFMGTYRGLEIDYSSEDSPLLTGGAVKKALALCTSSEVFILNGDTWFDIDFDIMEEALSVHGSAHCCIAVKRMFNFKRYGVVEANSDGTIKSFCEKEPRSEGLINGGIYLIKRDALRDAPNVFSLENDWFKQVVSQGKLIACECKGQFIDIGTPEDYERSQVLFGNSTIAVVKLALFDRDGTINVDVGHMHQINDCILIKSTVALMQHYSEDPEWRIAVVTNQAGIAKGLYSLSDMRLLHRQMSEKLHQFGVEVDGWYFCPHHPDFTCECNCRKPKPGMLLRAMRDFDVKPENSIMYGDKKTDHLAAKAAGVNFELVDYAYRG